MTQHDPSGSIAHTFARHPPLLISCPARSCSVVLWVKIHFVKSPDPAIPSVPVAAIAVRVFLSFAAAYFMSYALRSINAALAPVLANDLSLSASALGWLSSAFFLSFAILQWPLGIWLDKYGSRITEALLLCIAAVGTLIMAVSESLAMLSFGRILIGVGVASCLMAPNSYFRRHFAADRQAQLAMWMLVAGTLGALASTRPALSMAEWLGWRSLFFLATLLLLGSALAIWWLVPNDKPAKQSGEQANHATTQASTPIKDHEADSFLRILMHPYMMRVIPTTLFFSGGFTALHSLWAGPWMTDVLGMQPIEAGNALLIFNMTLLLSYVAMSFASPWLEKRQFVLDRQSVIGLFWFSGCLWLIILWQDPSAWWCWVLMTIGIPAVILLQTQTALLFPRQVAGRVLTTFNLVMFVGAFLLQWGIGLVVDLFQMFGMLRASALTSAFAIMAVLQLLSLAWYLKKRHST